ncbi:MAG TPA: TolC family protein [Terriglobia bacterium]|nr:TolC family protein [Terriglobia bacterium]
MRWLAQELENNTLAFSIPKRPDHGQSDRRLNGAASPQSGLAFAVQAMALVIALSQFLAAQTSLLPGKIDAVAVPSAPSASVTGSGPERSSGAIAVSELVKEALAHNPSVIAARRNWQAAEQVPSQVSTLPDPEISVQQFSVGNPRPFAGFITNNFAFVGFGISQDIPYPGKLRLRGEAAQRRAASFREQGNSMRRSISEEVKAAYFRLAYSQQALTILQRDGKLIEQIEKIAEARYRVGQGNQQDVLKAQLQRTKILQEEEIQRQEIGSLEARLKQILNRPPDSPSITTEEMTETALPYTSDELLSLVRTRNPDVLTQQQMVRSQSLQVELARKDFYPDFNVQYMWQQTGPQFPNYYTLTFGVHVPIWRSRRQRPELAQAVEELNSSRHEYEAQVQQTYFEVQDQFVKAETGARLLKIYREGLIPQATATFDAGLAAYQTGHEDFQTLLDSFLDVLNLNIEYWRTLASHETALARLEQLTGVNFP